MELCIEGDKAITDILTSANIKGGISFPTCISVDNIICHFSPSLLDAEASVKCLSAGSLVKIELGVHVDGFPALVGNTFICKNAVNESSNGSCEDTELALKSRLIDATYEASQAVLSLFAIAEQKDSLKTEKHSSAFNNLVCEVAKKHSFTPVQGALSYQIGQNSLDLEKQIPINLSEKDCKKIQKFDFEEGECYAVDIVVSSGDGRIRASPYKPCIFRQIPHNYRLKLNISNAAMNEVKNKFGYFSFNIRNATDPKKMRMGMLECTNHACVCASDVLMESENAYVARFLYTVMLTSDGPVLITEAKKVQ